MMSVSDQQGMSLVELLVAMLISIVVMGVLVAILTVVLNDNRYANFRSDAQADARSMIDRMSRDLRSAAATSAGTAGLLEKAGSYDIVFETVNANGGSAPSGDPADQIRVRYCLDSNETLWKQTQTLQTPTDTIPDTSTCPDTSSATGTSWGTKYAELSDVTNEIGGDTTRPLFTYGPLVGSPPSSPPISQINSVEIHLIVDRNPAHLPGPTDLTSGVYLRNELAPPTAQFSVTKTSETQGTDIYLNGSTSTDPNGQTLSYQWYQGVTCGPASSPPSSGAISGATSQQYDAGTYTSSQTFALVVTDTGGVTNCESTTVTVP
jgi:type II secretory pathway pseudopilin PulG